MRRLPLAFLLLALVTAPAIAETPHFDMTPEQDRGGGEPTPGIREPRPAPPADSTPTPPPAETPTSPALPPDAAAPGQVAAATTPVRRYLLPQATLRLPGETARRSWSVYLTPEEAASPAKLNFGYRNALVVAPEASQLTVTINDTPVIATPTRSPERIGEMSVAVPEGLLVAGANTVTVQSSARHRTDCTVESTYELWVDVDGSRTYLSFSDPAAGRMTRIEDVRSLGVDGSGSTRFEIVAPALGQPARTGSLVRLAEGLALLARMPNQTFTMTKEGSGAPAPGHMRIVVGTAPELEGVVGELPPAAGERPVASFVDDPKSGRSILVVSGPTWTAIDAAIAAMIRGTTDIQGTSRTELKTDTWRVPEAPLLRNGGRLTFAELGVSTTQFSGRRFKTDFLVGIPSDFYASAYGSARILLDAAYAQSVLPGSHIDIYVNGNIAATYPITSSNGGILRHLPISFTMRHLRPGVNTISLEAMLPSRNDESCLPGSASDATPRFALFDTSEFVMPRFARIGQRPNLAAIVGTGAPYSRASDPVPLVVGRNDPATFSAAATLLARMSVVAGHPIPVEATTNLAAMADRDAIFVGAVDDIPPGILAEVGIAATARQAWGNGGKSRPASLQGTDTQATFDAWRTKLRGQGWTGQVSAVEDWLNRNFDISLSGLRFAPKRTQAYLPPRTEDVLVAQAASPSGNATWTVVAAPSRKQLDDGVDALVSPANWYQVDGRLTTWSAATDKISSQPVNVFSFVPTQPPSFSNYRLIAANWLSTNILSYSIVLVVLCIILGLATAALLAMLGRRK